MNDRTDAGALTTTFALIQASSLLGHELTDKWRLQVLYRTLYQEGILQRPLLVDRHNMVILDGHHRFECLRRLGCWLIPAYLVNYFDPRIQVSSRRDGITVSKQAVLRRGINRRPYPPRTTCHTLTVSLFRRPIQLKNLACRDSAPPCQTMAPRPSWDVC